MRQNRHFTRKQMGKMIFYDDPLHGATWHGSLNQCTAN